MSRSMKEKASLNKIPTVLLFFWKQHLVIMTKKKTNRRKVMLLWLKFKSIKLVLILFFFPSSLLSSQEANHKWIITDQFLASNDDKTFVVNGIVGHLAFRSVLEWRRTTFFLVEICKDQSFFFKKENKDVTSMNMKRMSYRKTFNEKIYSQVLWVPSGSWFYSLDWFNWTISTKEGYISWSLAMCSI